ISGGKLKEILREFFLAFALKTYTTQDFLDHLRRSVPAGQSATLARLIAEEVYGLSCEWAKAPVAARSDTAVAVGDEGVLVDVLANDLSCWGAELALESWDASSGQGGTIEKREIFPGYFGLFYRPAPGFTGRDVFRYVLGGAPPAEVSILVRPYQ